jgi:hypothetical protein
MIFISKRWVKTPTTPTQMLRLANMLTEKNESPWSNPSFFLQGKNGGGVNFRPSQAALLA